MTYKLFLDDLRMPADVLNYKPGIEMYEETDWVIVRNFTEFCKVIFERWTYDGNKPSIISFDHDLGLEHTRYYFENGGHDNPPNPDDATFVEKTGKDCANWLINFCEDKGMPLPQFTVHSKNPVGSKNIQSLLEQYKRYVENGK